MKDLYSIIIFVSVAFCIFFGVSLIGSQALINGNLDEESINALAQYDSQVAEFRANFTTVQGDIEGLEDYEPDANLIEQFIVEYSETKDRVTQFKDGAKLVYKIPDLLIMSIPFVEFDDLTIFRNIIWFLITITLGIAIFNAIANRRLNSQ